MYIAIPANTVGNNYSANSYASKINVDGVLIISNGAVVSASNPLPVTGGTGGSSSASGNVVVTNTVNTNILNTSNVVILSGNNVIGSTIAGLGFFETSTVLAVANTFTGTTRNSGSASGTLSIYSYFQTQAFSDQAGILFTENSNDGTTWYPMNGAAGTTLSANSSITLKSPVTLQYARARYTNGNTAQTRFMLSTSFSVS